MRTTLKRGIGRGAALNGSGNGHAILPPAGAPRMRRFRVPPPPRRTTGQLVGWLFRRFFVAVVIVAVGIAGGAYLYGHQTLTAFEAKSAPVKRAQRYLEQTVADASKPAVALVVGYDQRKGADASFNGSRSDTIMLVRADPQLKAVSMLSFPRDLEVPIYCKGSVVGTDRINSAWSRCGPSSTVETVVHLTGIRPNYLITVDFHGFKLLVNKLHGVYLDVDHRYLNTQGGPYGYAKINLEPGYQKLDGQEALDFVRFRHTDSDLYRLARQQLFVTALRDRVASNSSIFTVFRIIGALKGNVEIAQGGGGAVPADTALSYLKFAHDLPSRHFLRITIDRNQISGFDTLSASQSAIDDAVHQFQTPDVEAPAKANAAAFGRKLKPKTPQLKPSQIDVLVLNGTTIPGLASDTSYRLALRGFHTVQLSGQQQANAPGQGSIANTTIYFDSAQANARFAARDLQKLFRGSVVSPMEPDIQPFAQSAANPQTVVVLGSNWDQELLVPTEPPDTTPKHEPPQVYSSPGTTLDYVRDAQRKVPFRLQVPHVLEKRSRLAALTPVRVYKPAPDHKALRLTFVTGAGNVYWGIEETDWEDAPVLGHPTVTHKFKGRHFDFYFSGSHLHMIVLRGKTATYWVVNTLLDELSNETMIAIAKGLQPLSRP